MIALSRLRAVERFNDLRDQWLAPSPKNGWSPLVTIGKKNRVSVAKEAFGPRNRVDF